MSTRRQSSENLPFDPESGVEQLVRRTAALTHALAEGHEEPPGGVLSALVLALAASLAASAADRSRAGWDGAAGARAQAQALRRRALALARQDAADYARARDALTARAREALSPLDAGGPDPARDWELGRAVREAARAPEQLASAGADAAELARVIVDRGAGDVRADAAAAAILAAAAATAAAHLVEINLVAGVDHELLARVRGHTKRASLAAQEASRLE
jgi:formiminotetrahydrofolate cyclodeaminase